MGLDLLAKINTVAAESKGVSYYGTRLNANAVALNTGVITSIASVGLPAGTYLASGTLCLVPNTTTSLTSIIGGVSLSPSTLPGVSGDPPNGPEYRFRGPGLVNPTVFNTSTAIVIPIAMYSFEIEDATTLYLNTAVAFTISTCQAFGWIHFRSLP